MELSIQNISKTYANGVRALQDVSLDIQTGMFGLPGPNPNFSPTYGCNGRYMELPASLDSISLLDVSQRIRLRGLQSQA